MRPTAPAAAALPLILMMLTSCWYDTASILPGVHLLRPQDVDTDETGQRLFVADTENNRIHQIEVALYGKRVTAPLAGQKGQCKMSKEAGGEDAGGKDAGGMTARRPECYSDGNLAEARFRKPTGIAIDPDGSTVFVADTGNHSIRVIRADKDTVYTIAGNGVAGYNDGLSKSAQFDTPTGLDFDFNQKKIYVADSKNARVRVIAIDYLDPKKSMVSTLCHEGTCTGFTFQQPVDLACNSKCSKLYVVDKAAGAIVEIDTAKMTAKVIDQDDRFKNGLSGIAVAKSGKVFASINSKIWSYAGTHEVEIKTDTTDRVFGASADALAAKTLRSPAGLAACSGEGPLKLYVAEISSNQIRQITPDTISLPDFGIQDLAMDAAADTAAVDAAADTAAVDAATDATGQ